MPKSKPAPIPPEFQAVAAMIHADIDRIRPSRRAGTTVQVRQSMGYPTIESEPSLAEWLAGHHAELVWQTTVGQINGVPALLIACYQFPNKRAAIVTVGAHGVGWDIATASGSTEIDQVLGDAESRLDIY